MSRHVRLIPYGQEGVPLPVKPKEPYNGDFHHFIGKNKGSIVKKVNRCPKCPCCSTAKNKQNQGRGP